MPTLPMTPPMIFLQLTINALIAGAMYALVAAGFSLIYATSRFVHFAHGAVVGAGAYIFFALFSRLDWPASLATMATLLLAGFLGLVLYGLIYEPLMRRKASAVILLIASIGLLILINNSFLLIFGADVQTIDIVGWHEGIDLFGAVITKLQLLIIAVAAVLFVLLQLVMKRTRWGATVRAVADNPELALIAGIPVRRVQATGFALGSALAAVAGILIGLEQNIEPYMGVQLIIKGYTGAVIGGVTSLPGAVAGSFLVGAAENYGIWYLPSGYKDAIAFVLLLVFLIARPQGILGINKGIRQ